ncbi:MAG TPA: DUF503 domain-containing protein [Armatimonadota bacterium]|jgi:hypothetical protein
MAIVVGLCTVDLSIPESYSLKDKRQVVRSLVEGLRNKFNVSASEVENLDKWRTATLAIANVSNDARFCDQVLSKVVDTIRSNPRVSLMDYEIEMV